jgi:hypothetical protein
MAAWLKKFEGLNNGALKSLGASRVRVGTIRV